MSGRGRLPILYEDGELLVIDKPAGLLSVGTEAERTATAWRQATDYLQIRKKRARAYVVHRLDRDTSGVLLFAKTEALKQALQAQWNDLVTYRGYLAVVEGRPPHQEATLHAYLLENRAHVVYAAPKSRGGREAVTHYKVLDSRRGLTLLDVAIDTGRKNQIRVQLADLGCPVSGDKKYGHGPGPLGRLGLHAARLDLRHPATGKALSFTAPMPPPFARLFPQITLKEEDPPCE